MTETLISDTDLQTAVLLAVSCSSHGLVFEANRSRLQVFAGRVYSAPSKNPFVAGLTNLHGNIEPVYQLLPQSRANAEHSTQVALLSVSQGAHRVTLLLDAQPSVPGRLEPIQVAPPPALSRFALQGYEEMAPGDLKRQIWSVAIDSLIEHLAGQSFS
jgi:hypothetical protein